jgi:hypothetical protein
MYLKSGSPRAFIRHDFRFGYNGASLTMLPSDVALRHFDTRSSCRAELEKALDQAGLRRSTADETAAAIVPREVPLNQTTEPPSVPLL